MLAGILVGVLTNGIGNHCLGKDGAKRKAAIICEPKNNNIKLQSSVIANCHYRQESVALISLSVFKVWSVGGEEMKDIIQLRYLILVLFFLS